MRVNAEKLDPEANSSRVWRIGRFFWQNAVSKKTIYSDIEKKFIGAFMFDRVDPRTRRLLCITCKSLIVWLSSYLGAAVGNAIRDASVGLELTFRPGFCLDGLTIVTIWASSGGIAVLTLACGLIYIVLPRIPMWAGLFLLPGFAYMQYWLVEAWTVR